MPRITERWTSAVSHWSAVLRESQSQMGAIEREQMRRFLKRWSGRRGWLQFGLVFGAGSLSLITGTQLNPRLVARWTPARVLGATLTVGTAAAVAMVVIAAVGFGGLLGLLVPLWLVLGCIGVALPNSPALALNGHAETAGTAAALLGATQFGVAALIGPVFGLLGLTAVAMAAVIAGCLALSLAIYLLVVRPWQLEPMDPEVVLVAAH